MKLKDKSNLLLFILPILFVALHYFVYLGNYQSPFDGNEAFPDWFILVSNDPEPLNIEKIVRSKSVYPNYFHPFQNFEYHYTEKSGNETVIIEQGSMFSTDMKTIAGDPATYDEENVDGMFYRGFGVGDYPNELFFLVQYLIIVVFVLINVKKIIKFKNQIRHQTSVIHGR
ncbi:TPA: hypothetical protein DF272_05445 [Candidatus Falkowbacteria bacterium]|nr:hypothetical protein [Candidatus Falkowbacteria bacterium]